MSFQKSIHKPVLYKRELCKMLKVPYKPHYKCYLKRKLGILSWRERRDLKDYIYNLDHIYCFYIRVFWNANTI